jgi:heme/copper-type cytochrome/quinol oxidase subunit 4
VIIIGYPNGKTPSMKASTSSGVGDAGNALKAKPQIAASPAISIPPPITRPNGHRVMRDADGGPPMHMGSHSPLDYSALDALKKTESYRRRIRHAAILFRLMFLLGFIAAIVMTIALFAAALAGSHAPNAGVALLTMFVMTSIQIGAVVLCYFANRATWDCQRWAPMTMLILNALGAALYIFGGLMAAVSPDGDATLLVGGVLAALIPAIIAVLCFRAWDAIPKFLNQPIWCQKTLVYCGL